MRKLLESYITKVIIVMCCFKNNYVIYFLSFFRVQYEDILKEKEAEEKRRYPLELRLKEKIIGQEAAIASVASGAINKIVYTCLIGLYFHTQH